MVAGFAAIEEAGGRPRRVLGVDASAEPTRTRDQIARIAAATAPLIGVRREITVDDIELDERYHAGTYGIPDDTTLDAMRLAARTEGMITDPVYEESRWPPPSTSWRAARSTGTPPSSTPISVANRH